MDSRHLAVVAFAALATATAAAEDGGRPFEAALQLRVGEVASICPCPVFNVICDDPSVAVPVDMKDGVGLKGLSTGSTLCSASDALRVRRLYRVKVRDDARDGGAR